MQKRMKWIDIAKGICMIAVILGHLGVPLWNFVYSFHLTVFFILSGYTLRKEPITKGWLKDKFQRLMTPYFITCPAVTLMNAVNNTLIWESRTIAGFTKTLFNGLLSGFFASGGNSNLGAISMGPRIGAIWFLPAMFFALILVRLLLNKIRGGKWQMLCAIGLAAVGCTLAELIWLPFSIQSAMLAVPFILVGFYLREYQGLEKIKWWHLPILAAVFIGGCYMKWHPLYFVNCTAANWLFTPILALFSSLLVLGISRGIKKCPPLEGLGRNSLTVLCIHLFELNTMHAHYKSLFLQIGLPFEKPIIFVAEILFILLVMGLIGLWKRWGNKKEKASTQPGRDLSVDIMRSFLIISMIFGHVAIDAGLRKVIYSIHMMAFVIISGYFYNDQLPLLKQWKKCLKMLIPYGAFAVVALVLGSKTIGDLAMGLSLGKQWFSGFSSVGPVYFILLLFLVRWIYSLLRVRSELLRCGLVIGLAAIGLWLGKGGYWLPWSLDCALVAMLFYHLGFSMRKYRVLERCREWPILYFLFASLWAYMIHKGSMEIAIRNYGDVGITIVGVFGGFMVLYQLCTYLAAHWPAWFAKIFSLIGQSTGWILVFHALFGARIAEILSEQLGLWKENVAYLIATIVLQVLAGVLIYLVIELLKKAMKKRVA